MGTQSTWEGLCCSNHTEMKLAAFSIALLGGTEALKCSASRGPRPDDVADFVPTTQPMMMRQISTQAYYDPGFNELPPQSPGEECVCGIEDYNDRNVASWRTNCPSGCAIYNYLDEVESKINDDWNRLEKKFGQVRSGNVDEIHSTLDEILKRIKEALRTIKKEKDQFLKIRQIYRSGGISDIINDQRVKLAELTTQKSKLQIQLSDKQKEFKEQAGFCKVSFMQYDEEVCDILNYAKDY